jgi:hypothetical protein
MQEWWFGGVLMAAAGGFAVLRVASQWRRRLGGVSGAARRVLRRRDDPRRFLVHRQRRGALDRLALHRRNRRGRCISVLLPLDTGAAQLEALATSASWLGGAVLLLGSTLVREDR